MNKTTLTLVSGSFLIGSVCAEPVVENVLLSMETNHSLITVVGKNFGSKFVKAGSEPYAALIETTFETDREGALLEEGVFFADFDDHWQDRDNLGDATRPTVSSEVRSSELGQNRSLLLRHTRNETGTVSPLLLARNIDFESGGKIFYSFWVKFKWPDLNPNVSYQFKLSEIATDIQGGGHKPGGADMELVNWVYPSEEGVYTKTNYRNVNGGGETNTIYFDNNTIEIDFDYWKNIVLFWDPGTAGVADGRVWSWVSSDSRPYHMTGALNKYLNEASLGVYTEPQSKFPNSIKLAWYFSKLSSWDVSVYFDDIIVDNSWAQVFIGDKKTFSETTILERQNIIDWEGLDGTDNDTVTFQFRYGGLLKDGPLYLYVFDEEGNYNSDGFEISELIKGVALNQPGPSSLSF